MHLVRDDQHRNNRVLALLKQITALLFTLVILPKKVGALYYALLSGA